MADEMEEFVMKNLHAAGVDFLQALCEEFRIVVPNEKNDDKSYLVKVVRRYLVSEPVELLQDGGAALILKLHGELVEELARGAPNNEPPALENNEHDDAQAEPQVGVPPIKAEPQVEAPPVKNEPGGPPKLNGAPVADKGRTSTTLSKSVKSDSPASANPHLSYHKLRQFKVNGSIGDPGQKGCLPYSSLCFEIKRGEREGYSLTEIYAGIIRAIEAGNPFRDVLELAADELSFDREALMTAIRSHFEEKDRSELANELRLCIQGPTETAHKFACRAVALKKKIENISKLENLPLDVDDHRRNFFRAVYTGLRQNNIRNELRHILQEASISDHDLLMEVARAGANEKERLGKFNEGKPGAKVNKITCDSDSEESGGASPRNVPQTAPPSDPAKSRATTKGGHNKKGPKSGQQQQSSPDVFSAESKQVLAEVSKIASAVQVLSESNAQLTAEIGVLKGQLAKSNQPRPPLPPSQNINNNNVNNANGVPANFPVVGNNVAGPPGLLNTGAPVFRPPLVQNTPARMSASGRPIYMCPTCIARNVRYCNHCFKCGSDSHKSYECTLNC